MRMAVLLWKVVKWCFLIVFASIVGAYLGTGLGIAVSAMTGDPGWVAHGRCAGWSVFAVVAAVGAPFGFGRFGPASISREDTNQNRRATRVFKRRRAAPVVQKTVTGIKAILVAPLLGAFAGLILGGMLGGFLIAVYFFVALSPLGPGGWWPILPLTFQATGDGFNTRESVILIPWLIVVATFVVLGAALATWTGVTCGNTRYRVFGSDGN